MCSQEPLYQYVMISQVMTLSLIKKAGFIHLLPMGWNQYTCKCFTCVTKTCANLTTYSRKPGDYNGTIILEIDIMKNSSSLNLKFTLFAMSKPKQQFFSAGLTALSAQLRVNQNKRNNQNNCEKVKFDKDLN